MTTRKVALVICCLIGCGCSMVQPEADVIKKMMEEHPEIVMGILEKNKIRLAEIVEAGLIEKSQIIKMKAYEENIKNPFSLKLDTHRPILGEKDAPITIIVYSDFLCSHCSESAKNVRRFIATHKDNTRMQYKHRPWNQLSFLAAEYYEAIGIQDHHLAWLFHDRLFENQETYAKEGEKYLIQLASGLHIDLKQLALDIKKDQILNNIKSDLEEATKIGVSGTPTMFINGVKLVGAVPVEEMEYLLARINLNN